MSQGLSSSGNGRDYGANGVTVPAVGFADFSPTELYSLSENIAASISTINSGYRAVEKALRAVGTPVDNEAFREKTHTVQLNANAAVVATTRDLKRLGVVVRRGDKPQKLQLERLAQAFTDALAKYSVAQKQLSEKMQAHMPRKGQTTDQVLIDINAEDEDERAKLLQQKQLQVRQATFESSLLEEREAYIKQIEADVLDVNQIMRELGAMVQAQGSSIDIIENSIEAAGANVELGAEELVKASRYQAKFRRKLFILIGIAVIVIIIIAVVLYRTL